MIPGVVAYERDPDLRVREFGGEGVEQATGFEPATRGLGS